MWIRIGLLFSYLTSFTLCGIQPWDQKVFTSLFILTDDILFLYYACILLHILGVANQFITVTTSSLSFNFRPIASVEGRKLQGTKITLYTVLNSKTVAANKFFYSIWNMLLFKRTIPTKMFPAALRDSAGEVPSRKARACPIFLTMNCITPR